MGLEFITSFIAALIAFNFHLPEGKQVVELTKPGLIAEIPREQMLVHLNNACIGLLTETFNTTPASLQETMVPLIDQLQGQKSSSIGKAFLGKFSMDDILSSYKSLCGPSIDPVSEEAKNMPVEKGINHFLTLLSDLPQSATLSELHKKESSPVFSARGMKVGYLNFSEDKNRITVKPEDIPKGLKLAFVSAEDKTFYINSGVDLRGIFNAFVNSGSGNQLYGGSTITQQLIKNTLLNYERSLDRKINEVLLAYAVTKRYNKEQIISHYLNHIYFGRGAYGVKAAAGAYLGKELTDLSLTDMAFLASLPQSPSNYDPAKNYEVILNRKNKVIGNLYDNGYISLEAKNRASEEPIEYITEDQKPVSLSSQYFIDATKNELLQKLGPGLDQSISYQIVTSIEPDLQVALTRSLQRGLVRYEKDLLRAYQSSKASDFVMADIGNRIRQVEQKKAERIRALKEVQSLEEDNRKKAQSLRGRRRANQDFVNKDTVTKEENKPEMKAKPEWQIQLARISNIYQDTGWLLAVALGKNRFGLKNGVEVKLSEEASGFGWWNKFNFGEVILVEKISSKEDEAARYYVRKPTEVQGAAVVIDNYTGEVEALTGGFSYTTAPFNRAVLGLRQPGSVMKPFSYLAALEMGYQPNYMIQDAEHWFARIAKGGQAWSPNSFGTPSNDWHSLRMGLEKSNNRMTAHLLKLLDRTPRESLNKVRELSESFGVYDETWGDSLSFILGAQPTGLVNVAKAYAAIANGGKKVSPHLIKRVRTDKEVLFDSTGDHFGFESVGVDNLALFQLRSFLGGVTSRGTAQILKEHSKYIIGKTGTTNRNQDAWFAGSTPDFTIVVWVGYDNATKSEKKYLVRAGTGGGVAAPVVKYFIESDSFKSRKQDLRKFPMPEINYEVGYFNHEDGFISTPEDPKAIKEFFKPSSMWFDSYRDSQLASFQADYADEIKNQYLDQDIPGLNYHLGNYANSYYVNTREKSVEPSTFASTQENQNYQYIDPADQATPKQQKNTGYLIEGLNPENIYVAGTTEYQAYMAYLNRGGKPNQFTRSKLKDEVRKLNRPSEQYPKVIYQQTREEDNVDDIF